jgi:hypothetical protein
MIKINNLGGYCPVQADVNAFGYYGYFRSRWNRVSLEFAKTEENWKNDDIVWADYELYTTKLYEAGYLPTWKCKLLIYWGCVKFGLCLLYDKTKEKIMC